MTRARTAASLLVAGALALGTVGAAAGAESPTTATPQDRTSTAPVQVDLPRPLAGRAAVRALADDLPAAATLNNQSSAELRDLLLEDPTMWLDEQGRLFVRDVLDTAHQHEPASTAASVAPLADTFALHSLPGAKRTIFLDFDGHHLTNTIWNTQDGVAPGEREGWDPDGNGPGFTDRERGLVQEIWARVAEDYAPYDVDVTTADPGEAALQRSSSNDSTYGMRALFTDDTALFDEVAGGSTVGLAYVGIFDRVDSRNVAPALIFTSRMQARPSLLADVASHEVGHTLGLPHITGTRTPLHGPLMLPMVTNSAITQWALPDVTAIANGVLTLRADEAGDTAVTATAMVDSVLSGVISSASDEDWYRLNACTTVTLTAAPASHGANLDLTMRLVDASGATVASSAPTTILSGGVVSGQGAGLARTLDGRTHYVVLAGGGDGPGGATGVYDRTGSIGGYTLDVVGCDSSAAPPGIPRSVRAITTAGGVTTVTWQEPSDSGGSVITSYEVSVDGQAAATLAADRRTHSVTTGPGRRPVTIRARNAAGVSGAVAVTSATPPGAPTSPAVTYDAASDAMILTWVAPSDDGGSAIEHRVRVAGGPWTTVPHPGTSHQFSATRPTGQSFEVIARNSAGDSPSARVYASGRDKTPVAAPGKGKVTAVKPGRRGGARTVRVKWVPATATGGASLTGHRLVVQRLGARGKAVSTSRTKAFAAGKRSHQVTLRRKGRYRFAVQSRNITGWGSMSAWSTAVVPR